VSHTFVVDASVAVEYLLRTPLGLRAAPMIEGADVVAPELLDAEVLAVLRRALVARRLPETRALEAVEDLAAWDLQRVAHRGLLVRAWARRHNVTGYDAFYVATAELFRATLLTADGPLARARPRGVAIQNLTLSG
jgi:predicted nucleic acid-binding protein